MSIKEIKQSARMELKNSYLKCASATLLYYILTMILNYFLKIIEISLKDYTVWLGLIQAIYAIILAIISYGLISNIIALTTHKTTSITKFIDFSFFHTGKYIKVLIHVLIKIIVPLAIFLLSLFYFIGTLIANIFSKDFLCFYANLLPVAIITIIITSCILGFFILKYILIAYIFNNNPELSPKEIANKSNELMKGQKIKFLLLMLSFIGWFIPIIIILAILRNFFTMETLTPIVVVFYSLLRPYTVVSKNAFLEDLG